MNNMFNLNPQMMETMKQLQSNPIEMLRQKGVNIPDNINDPKEIVMHLIQTGQVNGNAMQRIMPMIRMMNGK